MSFQGDNVKNVIIGIDIGSTNIKTVIFDKDFNILANVSEEIDIIFPRPGWTEYDPGEWWKKVKITLKKGLTISKADPKKISGIGISSLGCCAVPLDRDGLHLYNAIPWSDQRTVKEVEFLEKNCRDSIYSASGNIPTRISPTPRLLWIKNNEPEIYKKTFKYTEASGFIGAKFTGKFTLDYSMASGLDFGFNSKKLKFDEDIISSMNLDIEKFPELHPNTEKIGYVSKNVSNELGLIDGIPVYIGGLDILSALLAAGAVSSGQGVYSMGSAANMMFVTNKKATTPYLQTYIHLIDPGKMRILNGTQGSIGYSLKWFKNEFGIPEMEASKLFNNRVDPFQLMDMLAEKVHPGSNGLIYFPFLFGKYHPIFSETVKGIFFNITPMTTRSHFIRAIMEGCTYNMYENIKSAEEIGINLDEIIVSGGPSRSALWCQIISDITDKRIQTIKNPEGSPLGNAMLVSVGEGLFSSFEEVIKKAVIKDKVYEPDATNHKIYTDLFEMYKDFYNACLPVYNKFEYLFK